MMVVSLAVLVDDMWTCAASDLSMEIAVFLSSYWLNFIEFVIKIGKPLDFINVR